MSRSLFSLDGRVALLDPIRAGLAHAGLHGGQQLVVINVVGIVVLHIARLLELQHDRRWPHRGKGLLALAHALLALVVPLRPGLAVPILWLILILGSVGSHMPRRWRHWSLLDGPEQRPDRR